MARRKGSELLTGRNLAIAGTGLLLTAAGVTYGYSRLQRRRAERPNMSLAWDEEAYPPFETEVDRATADLSMYSGKDFRHHLAVLGVSRPTYDEHMSRSEGRAAIAVRDGRGLWHPGVAASGTQFGEGPESWSEKRIVAVGLGRQAMSDVQLGIMDQEGFVPFDAETLDVSDARILRREYPDLLVASGPPATLFAEAPGAL